MDTEPQVPSNLSHYRIVEKIGRGGMGEVFLAEDQRLRRKVALKVLPGELTRDEERRRRFVTEARAAAQIEHPHIAAIYEIDEFEGRTFIAMEYVRGQSLRQAIKAKALDFGRALEIGIQVAEGLTKVHERGVVHRDLKPENILISDDGYAKIIDFGLAKLVEPLWTASYAEQTQTATSYSTKKGQVMGTIAYMSPEQAKGEPVDARSDIFSFAVLLYEMLSGNVPFKRGSAVETLSAILRDPPPPLRIEAKQTPPEIHRLLLKALNKEPADRYQAMKDLVVDLRKVRDRVQEGKRPLLFKLSLGIAALALVAAIASWIWGPDVKPPPPARDPVSVLIADFENTTNDAVFDGALEQVLSISLEGAPFITAYDRPRARLEAKRLEPEGEGRLDERLAQLVGVSLGIKVALTGTIESAGSGYQIAIRATDLTSSEVVAEAKSSARTKADVLKAADSLASDIRSKLGDTELAPVGETFSTQSLEAMNAYAAAQEARRIGESDRAIEGYRKAIELDPDFGRAYSGLAVMMANKGEREEAIKYYEQALARIDRMSDREKYRTRGAYYLTILNTPKAIEEYSNLVNQFPADEAGRSNLALAHFYNRDMAKAQEEGRLAADIYPKNVILRNNLALYAMYAGDFETAEREARQVMELNPKYDKPYVAIALSALGQGRLDEAVKTYEQLQPLGGRGTSLGASGMVDLSLYQGRLADAANLLETAVAGDVESKLTSAAAAKEALFASVVLLRGEVAAARDAADRAVQASRGESVLYAAGRVYAGAGEPKKALELASELGGKIQVEPRLYAKLIEGEVALAEGDAPGALGAFQQAQQLADTWLGRFSLGRAYLAAEAYTEAYSEFETCIKRRGEATAVFLDDVPSYGMLPQVYYYLGRAQEGLKSAAAAESYQKFVDLVGAADEHPLLADARARLKAAGVPLVSN